MSFQFTLSSTFTAPPFISLQDPSFTCSTDLSPSRPVSGATSTLSPSNTIERIKDLKEIGLAPTYLLVKSKDIKDRCNSVYPRKALPPMRVDESPKSIQEGCAYISTSVLEIPSPSLFQFDPFFSRPSIYLDDQPGPSRAVPEQVPAGNNLENELKVQTQTDFQIRILEFAILLEKEGITEQEFNHKFFLELLSSQQARKHDFRKIDDLAKPAITIDDIRGLVKDYIKIHQSHLVKSRRVLKKARTRFSEVAEHLAAIEVTLKRNNINDPFKKLLSRKRKTFSLESKEVKQEDEVKGKMVQESFYLSRSTKDAAIKNPTIYGLELIKLIKEQKLKNIDDKRKIQEPPCLSSTSHAIEEDEVDTSPINSSNQSKEVMKMKNLSVIDEDIVDLTNPVASSVLIDSEELIGFSWKTEPVVIGGHYTVYYGKHDASGLPAVVKIQRKDLVKKSWIPGHAEMNCLRKLNHPAFLKVFYQGNNPMLIMELFHHVSLKTVLKDGEMKMERVGMIFSQIIRGIIYLHKNNFVHRHLNTEAILIGENLVKIGKMIFAAEPPSKLVIKDIPNKSFFAPEILRGRNSSAKSDCWSVGIILFNMITGKLPFLGETVEDLKNAVEEDWTLKAKIPEEPAVVLSLLLVLNEKKRSPLTELLSFSWPPQSDGETVAIKGREEWGDDRLIKLVVDSRKTTYGRVAESIKNGTFNEYHANYLAFKEAQSRDLLQ